MHAEEGVTRILRDGALHYSAQQDTATHAHFAWKVHVGVDAPVWLREGADEATMRVLVVPPGCRHATGATGWSAALFFSPGRRSLPWRGDRPFVLEGAAARRVVDVCRGYGASDRGGFDAFVDEVARLVFVDLPQARIDSRVEATLDTLANDPDVGAAQLAGELGVSVDRLSRLVVHGTGMGLRRHALWRRLLGALSDTTRHETLAAVAYAHGFSDHAHMTRTYRSFLGRVPSEFSGPPDVVAPW